MTAKSRRRREAQRAATDRSAGCRLVGGRADSDPSQPLVACHHLSAHIRGEMNKVADAQRNLFSACPQYAAASDYCVHLLLIVPTVIVLRPLCARGQFELIDPKTRDAELICQRTKDPVPRLHLTDINYLM